MRKMKDSGVPWIGEIPEDWQLQKIKFLAGCNNEVLAENTPPSELIKYIDISSVNEKQGILLIQDFIFSNAPSRARRVIHEGDVIISTVRTYLRAVAYIYREYNNYICSTGFAVLSSYNDKIINRFLFFSILSDNFISTVELLSTGISYPAITSEQLVDIKICLPSIVQQQQIVTYLDLKCSRIDSTIANIHTLIEKLKEYKQSVITQAVTKGLDPDAPMKDSGVPWIGEIPSTWNVIKLKYLLDNKKNALRVGPFGSAIKSSDWKDSGYPVYTQKNVIDNDFYNINTFINETKFKELKDFKLNGGEFVITTRGTIGTLAISPINIESGIIHPCLIKFVTSDKINNKYLLYYFNFTNITHEQFILLSNSTTLPVIYSYTLRDIQISLPHISEQNRIVDYLDKKCDQIDAKITEQESLLEKLETYKKSLIYECVTGKREIPASFADAS